MKFACNSLWPTGSSGAQLLESLPRPRVELSVGDPRRLHATGQEVLPRPGGIATGYEQEEEG